MSLQVSYDESKPLMRKPHFFLRAENLFHEQDIGQSLDLKGGPDRQLKTQLVHEAQVRGGFEQESTELKVMERIEEGMKTQFLHEARVRESNRGPQS